MARNKNNEAEVGKDKGRIRFVFAEMEGSNESLQDFVKTMAIHMNRPAVMPQVPKQLITDADQGKRQKTPDGPSLFDGDENSETESANAENEPVVSPTSENTRQRRGTGPKRDRNSGLAIVKSLNLRPQGKPSLKDFVAEKNPQSQMEHIAVYVYYLKRILEESGVGFSHLFTCFKEVGERLPEDLPQTSRNAASSKGWIDTAQQDDLKISTRGENLVEHELPKTNTSGD